jgi:hypothetical protein
MKARSLFFASCAAILLSAGIAQAGPCNTASKNKDAGSGPTPGHTAQTTTGTPASSSGEHPPTNRMNRADNLATSSDDAQKQMQGQPTAAQEAQGAKANAGAGDGC